MTLEASVPSSAARRESSSLTGEFFSQEDWWAVWIGLAIVVVAALLFESGSSIKWLAIAPKKWSTLPDIIGQLGTHALQYAALFVVWATLLGIGARSVGLRLAHFLPSFAFLFVVTIPIFALGLWDQAARYSLEPNDISQQAPDAPNTRPHRSATRAARRSERRGRRSSEGLERQTRREPIAVPYRSPGSDVGNHR
jgi:hypothetical protein